MNFNDSAPPVRRRRPSSPVEALASVAAGLMRSVAARSPDSGRPTPRPEARELAEPQSFEARRTSASMMRINDAGEVAAQGLYDGQRLFARKPETSAHLDQAALEEADHLRWCRERLGELDARPSRLNPFWYGAAYALGAVASLLGDRVSYGFLAETERQVVRHLEDHLTRMPAEDTASRAILEQMLEDEAEHRDSAVDAGGADLPAPLRTAMHLASRVMIRTAAHV